MSNLTISLQSQQGTIRQTASGEQTVTLSIPNYQQGDCLLFQCTPNSAVWVQVNDAVAKALVFAPTGSFDFPIPSGEALRGFAPDTFAGPQTVVMEAATQEDLDTYRNLCINPLDRRLEQEVVDPDAPEWSNPTDSAAVAQQKVAAFPHAYANRVTRNEGSFFARNAIDGIVTGGGHGDYPYHSWGGAVHEDLSFTVYFGRKVTTDKIVLFLRSDYTQNESGQEHDTYWHTAVLEFSDGSELAIHPKKTGEGQPFSFDPKQTEWVKFKRMDPMQIPQSQNFAALEQFEVWGRG